MYVGSDGFEDPAYTLWRLPRQGGAPELLFATNDRIFAGAFASLVQDDDALYFGRDRDIYRIPKSGGVPTLVWKDTYDPRSLRLGLAFSSGSLVSMPLSLSLSFLRTAADGSKQPETIRVDLQDPQLWTRRGFVVADGAGTYAAIDVGGPTVEYVAFGRIPNGTERVSFGACLPSSAYVRDMALDASHVYALLSDEVGWRIVRAAR